MPTVPVDNDRLNVLAKYTFFYNVPAAEQITGTTRRPALCSAATSRRWMSCTI